MADADARRRAEERVRYLLAELDRWDAQYRPLTLNVDADDLRALLAAGPEAPPSDAVREAAEVVVRDDWWGHYCPCCGSTFKHGPECLIGRLAKALADALAARGGE